MLDDAAVRVAQAIQSQGGERYLQSLLKELEGRGIYIHRKQAYRERKKLEEIYSRYEVQNTSLVQELEEKVKSVQFL